MLHVEPFILTFKSVLYMHVLEDYLEQSVLSILINIRPMGIYILNIVFLRYLDLQSIGHLQVFWWIRAAYAKCFQHSPTDYKPPWPVPCTLKSCVFSFKSLFGLFQVLKNQPMYFDTQKKYGSNSVILENPENLSH